MKRLAFLSLLIFSCEKEERTLTERGRQIVQHRPPELTPERPMIEPDGEVAGSVELPQASYSELTQALHSSISANPDPVSSPSYTELVPLADDAAIEMVSIPGGTLLIGSPDEETHRRPDEGPRVVVEIEPFWMGKHEITWDVYRAFFGGGGETLKSRRETEDRTAADARVRLAELVGQAPPPREAKHYEMGQGYTAGWPAIAMSHHAANRFCQWLSAQTGHYYRLPTEAEWEHACRAGTSTAYSFGNDPGRLNDFAWTRENSDFSYQQVGTRQPNPWGLHDMHGNVAEWCLDGYLPDAYAAWTENASNPFHQATGRFPCVVRGGSYADEDPAASMRSAAREASEARWVGSDPRKPKSVWYLSDNQRVGFRVVRPREVPDLPTMHAMWNRSDAPE